jgi:trimethylamine--corrinoid protein Co-methyltransferase
LAALAGANLIYGGGFLGTGIEFNYGSLVADAELVKNIRHVLKGIEVNEEYLAIDVIKEVGPRGHYLAHQHTYDHMRELSRSKLFDRTNARETWEKSGSKDLITRAEEKAREILESHKTEPLPEKVAANIAAIVEAAEKELAPKSK